jgi:zinc protease
MSKNIKFKKKILDNGIRVMLIPQKKSNIISMGIFVKAGSRNENKYNNGIAHFLEHMMFKGTKKRDTKKLLNDLDNRGAYYNAATSYEYTMYEVHGNYKDSSFFIDILLDIYKNSTLKKKDIKIEKGVIKEEINMYLDNNRRIVSDILYSMIYKNSSMGMSIIGPKKNILNFKKNDFVDFKNKFYLPENTVIVVTGKFDEKKIYSKIKKEMNNFYRENMKIDQEKNIIKYIQRKPNYKFIKKKLRQTIITISFRSKSMYNIKDNMKINLLCEILTGGTTSILFDLLRTKLGLVYYVSANNYEHIDSGIFKIDIGADNDNVLKVIKVVLNELKKIKKKLINDTIIKKIKKLSETIMLFQLEDHMNLLFRYGFSELFFKKYMSIEEEFKRQKKVNSKDIINISNEIFKKENLNIVVMGNVDSKEKIIKEINNF